MPTIPCTAGAWPDMRVRRAGMQVGDSESPRRKCVPVPPMKSICACGARGAPRGSGSRPAAGRSGSTGCSVDRPCAMQLLSQGGAALAGPGSVAGGMIRGRPRRQPAAAGAPFRSGRSAVAWPREPPPHPVRPAAVGRCRSRRRRARRRLRRPGGEPLGARQAPGAAQRRHAHLDVGAGQPAQPGRPQPAARPLPRAAPRRPGGAAARGRLRREAGRRLRRARRRTSTPPGGPASPAKRCAGTRPRSTTCSSATG